MANGGFYHVYNRGTDKRKVFFNKRDHQRFLDGLIFFNTSRKIGRFSPEAEIKRDDEMALVNIIVFCLMPNHFHLLLEQRVDGGIAKFMQKITTGYTMYFNKKYERSGVLFQGVFKSKQIPSNSYLLELTRYIHTNPAKILRLDGLKKADIKKYLLAYPWSSFSDYASVKDDCGIVSNKEVVMDQFDSPQSYVNFVLQGETLRSDDDARFRLAGRRFEQNRNAETGT